MSAVLQKTVAKPNGVAVSQASKLFQHQTWNAIQNHVDDRVRILPTGNTSFKLGDIVTFEFIPDADGALEVDFRCTLPSLYVPPPAGPMINDFFASNSPGVNDRGAAITAGPYIGKRLGLPADPSFHIGVQNGGIMTNPLVLLPMVGQATGVNDFARHRRYRIPGNPGASGLLFSTYAIHRPGPCGVNSTGCLTDEQVFNPHTNQGGGDNGILTGSVPTALPRYDYATAYPACYIGSGPAGNLNAAIDPFVTKSYDLPVPLWVDYVGYWMLEDIELFQSINKIQRFTGEQMFLFDQTFHNQETSDFYAELTGAWHRNPITNSAWSAIDLAYSRAPRDIVVPLDFLYWVGKVTQFLPQIALHQALTMKIKLRSPEYCMLFEAADFPVVGDGSTLYSWTKVSLPKIEVPIRGVSLEVHKFHMADIHRTELINQLDSAHGLLWKAWDVEQIKDYQVNESSGKVSTDISLLGIRGAVTSLFIVKRHQKDKSTPYETYWTNFLRINDYSLIAAKEEIIPKTDHLYGLERMHNLANNAKFPKYTIYAHHFSKVPGDKFNAWGHLEFGNLYNPTLKLNYAENHFDISTLLEPAVGQNLRPHTFSTGSPIEAGQIHVIDVIATVHQVIQHKSGNITRTFN